MTEKCNIFNLNSSQITGINILYIEKMHQKFLNNSHDISKFWKDFFIKNNINTFELQYQKYQFNEFNSNYDILEFQLINFFRTHGHKYSKLDPLNLLQKKNIFEDIISLHQLDISFLKTDNKNSKKLSDKKLQIKFNNIYQKYKKIYCSSVGIEYMYIDDIKEKIWIQNYVENKFLNFKLNKKKKIHILNKLIKSETLEKYLNTKFPGSKRFSLEGCEVLIPVLDYAVNYANNCLSSKVIIGMAHRGRLNVLVNILKKNISHVCYEFSDHYQNYDITGDVKYHMGMISERNINNKKIVIDLKPNPSHLEIINPVMMGSARAYIEEYSMFDSNNILPINIHGDAAIIGQGINQELLNMSKTVGYEVGGTVHIIINNQIGFTTSNKINLRSSKYCTDIAKITQSPVFHVNADHPESVIFIIKLALNFRYKFKRDVFIDLVCYRRNGHNEVDDPYVTQPLMYKKIKKHPTICEIYSQELQNKQIIDAIYFDNYKLYYRNKLEKQNKNTIFKKKNIHQNNIKKKFYLEKNHLQDLAKKISYIPDNFKIHDRVLKIYQSRYNMAVGKIPFDWGAAENLAYATLLNQGISCRLSGEDVSRGTFFHRHVILHDQKTGENYIPLHHLNNTNGKFYVWDSVLSEEAVLAFEYGYSINSYNTLNIWEAQFGDFVNGAQIIIDQFISSGEQKWNINSGLVMFLPHGYEGQGPEHSSARLERFLQLASQKNMKICFPSNASQIYHLLIKQAFSHIKKPLIIISPKSLLRHPLASSSFKTIQTEGFKKIIHEVDEIKLSSVKKIIFCCGKIYYELLQERRKCNQKNIVLIRIEQLYPFPKEKIFKLLSAYSRVTDFVWCQEEPKNQGAWNYIKSKIQKIIPINAKLNYVGRFSSASPAVGSIYTHVMQQKKIIHDALNIN
ncbi:2-oxoglutarate dehydrogenase E1 component [Buchnera aphidicola]|uniref:2-oxoglutarate dehydrogenase E1 component n=1 Tax=Buchnera aphidicola TaxID=9 RepID=UPI00346477D3